MRLVHFTDFIIKIYLLQLTTNVTVGNLLIVTQIFVCFFFFVRNDLGILNNSVIL